MQSGHSNAGSSSETMQAPRTTLRSGRTTSGGPGGSPKTISQLASALETRLPGVVDDIRRSLRDSVWQGKGLSAIGKHACRMATVWSALALSELSKGNTDGALKASREAETSFRRLTSEIDRSLAAHARRERPTVEGDGKTDGAPSLDDDASAGEG